MEDFKKVLKEHLDQMAKRDGNFAQMYRKPNKNFDECVNYIKREVAKEGNAIFVKREDVYSMAVHYYEEDSIKDIPPIDGHVSCSRRKVELTEEEREKLKEEVRQEFKEQYRKEISETRNANNEVGDVSEIEVPSMF